MHSGLKNYINHQQGPINIVYTVKKNAFFFWTMTHFISFLTNLCLIARLLSKGSSIIFSCYEKFQMCTKVETTAEESFFTHSQRIRCKNHNFIYNLHPLLTNVAISLGSKSQLLFHVLTAAIFQMPHILFQNTAYTILNTIFSNEIKMLF